MPTTTRRRSPWRPRRRENLNYCPELLDHYKAINHAIEANGQYDLCIMDVSMPQVDGLEAARTIRREVPYFPILGYSSDAALRDICLQSGMDDFLHKGSSTPELFEAIQDLTVKPLVLHNYQKQVSLLEAMPMNSEELKELRELKKKGLTKLKLVGLDKTFVVHKNIQNKISHDFIAEGKEVSEFIDRSPDEPGRCHLYKSNLYVTKDLFIPEELDEAIRAEDQTAQGYDAVADKPAAKQD